MNLNLEDKLNGMNRPKFKSKGERRIACFLEDYGIRYQYETGVLVNADNRKQRIWYPDFYLPEFSVYIEYYGLTGRRNYDKGTRKKESAYVKNSMAVISVYPWMFAENWQGYVLKELKKVTTRRYRNLMTKPVWKHERSVTYRKAAFPRSTYRSGPGRTY